MNNQGMTQQQVCDELGILPRSLRRWMQAGVVRPSVSKSNGGKLAHGQPNHNLFSLDDWLEIKTFVHLRQAQVGVALIKKVVEYIRQQGYFVKPGEVHQIGRVIWTDAEVVVGSPQYCPNKQGAVFLEWARLVQEAEAVFNRYSPQDDDLAWQPPTDQRSIQYRLAEVSQGP